MKKFAMLIVAALAVLWLAGDSKAGCCCGCCGPVYCAPAPVWTVYRPMPVGPVFYHAPATPVYVPPAAPAFQGCFGGCCGGMCIR